MNTVVLFMVVFLLYGAVGEEKTPIKLSNNNVPPASNPSDNAASSASIPKPLNNSNAAGSKNATSKDKATTPSIVVKSEGPSSHSDVTDMIGDNMFSRAAYLLTGISVLVLLYFAWKSFSLRRRQTHIHKYGVVASREDLEMTSLGFGSEDEEDDTTHFDIGKHQRS